MERSMAIHLWKSKLLDKENIENQKDNNQAPVEPKRQFIKIIRM